jgi:hypothetical protein
LVSMGGPGASVPLPVPWRSLGSSGFAPNSPSRFSCWNKSLHGGAQEKTDSSRFLQFFLATVDVERMVEKEEKIVLLGRAFCRRPHCWLSTLEATMAVDKERGGSSELKPAISGWSSPAMEFKVELRRLRWQPVFTQPLLLLVEGRPTLFLLAWMPYGRQFQLLSGGHGVQVLLLWRSSRPKWFVPGRGETESWWKLLWTRLLFYLSVRGPPCKSHGLVYWVLPDPSSVKKTDN